MNVSIRCVAPEILDDLDAGDPRARRARRDLQRVHAVMRSVPILVRAVDTLGLSAPPRRILELGGGDGTLMLRLARAVGSAWPGTELTLLDRVNVVSDDTREAFLKLGWRITVLEADALHWAESPPPGRYDLCVANLFLHHFENRPLESLLQGIAITSEAFVACEPRRNGASLLGSRLVGLLGASAVTRGDAVISVAAGFRDRELSSAWGATRPGWRIREYAAFPFTHCFLARRLDAHR